jgi:hypothetical protein
MKVTSSVMLPSETISEYRELFRLPSQEPFILGTTIVKTVHLIVVFS